MTRNKPFVQSRCKPHRPSRVFKRELFSRGWYQFKMFAKCTAGIKQIYYGSYRRSPFLRGPSFDCVTYLVFVVNGFWSGYTCLGWVMFGRCFLLRGASVCGELAAWNGEFVWSCTEAYKKDEMSYLWARLVIKKGYRNISVVQERSCKSRHL